MNYIYDITLNLNRKLYEFYEWKEEDNPEFILKIPVYKLDTETFLDMKYNDIIIDKKVLDEIEDKTEVYSPNSIDIIRYACVFVCDESTIAIEFDSSGNNYMKSTISIDEENELLEAISNIKYRVIDYKIKKSLKKLRKTLTRNEEIIQKEMLKRIDNMYNNNENTKLKYIFFEIYNEKIDDINKAYNKLINIILNSDDKMKKLNEILNLVEYRKIMSNNS